MAQITLITSFRDIVELWGPKDAHRSRINMGADIGVSAMLVTKWWQRDWVPPEYWTAILATEKAKEAGLSADLLAEIASRRAA